MTVNILSMRTDVTSLEKAVISVQNLSMRSKGAYVCVSNVHMCMESFDDTNFKYIVNSSDLVIPDGRPIFWAQRLLGFSQAQQVRGQDIMSELCRLSGAKGLKIGFYGGVSQQLLDVVVSRLSYQYPDIQIAFQYSPPFRPLTHIEDQEVINAINDSGTNILFVGIGCPKQERWMAAHKESLNCVMLGVGAAFDFISGSKSHAPRWMQKAGMEWLFRLCSEPKRLWKRYLKQNPRFIYYFLQQWLFGKKFD